MILPAITLFMRVFLILMLFSHTTALSTSIVIDVNFDTKKRIYFIKDIIV